jgi:hypothetical protein
MAIFNSYVSLPEGIFASYLSCRIHSKHWNLSLMKPKPLGGDVQTPYIPIHNYPVICAGTLWPVISNTWKPWISFGFICLFGIEYLV